MADEYINQDPIPAPPPPNISIRTMASDIRALQRGGGSLAKQEGEAFSYQQGKYFPGKLPGSEATIAAGGGQSKTGMWEFAGIIGIIAVIIIISTLVGYFLIYPWLFAGNS